MATIDHTSSQQARIRGLAALTILNAMMENGRVDMRALSDAANLLGVSPHCAGYEILNPLDRIAFERMPTELRNAIPDLIISCLNSGPAYRFTLGTAAEQAPSERQADFPRRFQLA